MSNKKLQKKNISIGAKSVLAKKEWFLEYSVQQNCFHIDTLDRILEANIDMCTRRVCTGYIIVAGPMVYDDLGMHMKRFERAGWWMKDVLGTGKVYKMLPNGEYTFVKGVK